MPIHCLCSCAMIMHLLILLIFVYKMMYAHTDLKIMEVSGKNYLINCPLILVICSLT